MAAEGGLTGSGAVNSEQIVRWNPEWIVTGTDPGREQEARARLLADPAIALTQAAREGHILVLENRVLLPLSPFTTRLVDRAGRGSLWIGTYPWGASTQHFCHSSS